MKDFTDSEIVDAILTRDASVVNEATTQLYNQNHRLITQMVRKSGGTNDDAQDLFQDLILAFLDNVWAGSYRPQKGVKLSTYLYKMGRFIWFKKIRTSLSTAEREKNYVRDFQESTPDEENPLDLLIDVDQERWSLSIFRKLSDDAQDLLRAFYHEKLSFSEIVVLLKFPSVAAAKMKKSRDLRDLSNLIKNSKHYNP